MIAGVVNLARWNDGHALAVEPRGEDPLYYYFSSDSWENVLGFEIDPLYRESEVTEVTIRLFADHAAREAMMSKVARDLMYQRVVPTLIERFPKWSKVALHSNYLHEVLEDGSIQAAFRKAGYTSIDERSGGSERTWRKA